MVLEHVKGWDVTDVYVGCSGAFTIERALRHLGLSLHSNDVQLHSCALGWHFSGADVAITVAEIHRGRFAWLERYLIDPADRTATVMLANSLFANSTSTNPWYERMCRAGEAQWPALHAKTVERLRAVDLTVASFYAGDVMEWVGRCKTDQAFLSFPPYMASGYETMFATVDDLFDWPKPDYDIFDEDTRLRLIEQVGAFRHWMLGTPNRYDTLEPYLRGVIQHTSRKIPLYVYSSGGPTRIVLPHQASAPVLVPRLGPGDELGSRLSLAPLTQPQFNALRSQYLNPHIPPGTPVLMLAVLADGVLIGCCAMKRDTYGLGDAIYMMSDFAVAPSDYPRLSKLVLHAALSTEARRLVERCMSKRMTTVVTTAFTKGRPVSMKYRGLFELTKRSESDDPLYDWQLQYKARLGQWSLAEGYAEWTRRHGRKTAQ